MSDTKPKKFLLWGCLGCLGLIGLFLIVAFGTVGFVWQDVKKEVPQTSTVDVAPDEIAQAAGTDAAVLLVLDIDYADVHIEAVDEQDGFRAEATYDQRSNAFQETRDRSPDGPMTWTLEFRRTSKVPLAALRTLFGGTKSTIRIKVPHGVPLAIEGELANGAFQGELGGIAARSIDIRMMRGAIVLGIDRPLDEPMERFAVDVSQGANVIGGLGNASPRDVDIGCSMGGCVIDLDGAWRNDATIALSSAMAGAVLSLAEDATHEGLEGLKGYEGFDSGPEPEVALPTLRFTVDGKWEIQ